MSKTKLSNLSNFSEKFTKGAGEAASTIINTLKALPIVGGLFEDLDRKVPEWITGINDSDRVAKLLQELQALSAKRNTSINDINKMITSLENAGFSVSGQVKSAMAKARTALSNRASELAKQDTIAQTLSDHALNIAQQGSLLSEGIRGKGVEDKINKVKENIYAIQEKFK